MDGNNLRSEFKDSFDSGAPVIRRWQMFWEACTHINVGWSNIFGEGWKNNY